MTDHTQHNGNAFNDLTVYHATAQATYLCAYTFTAFTRDGHADRDWCPGVIEPGDDHIAVYTDDGTILHYCLGCGHHLYGRPTVAPARSRTA